MNSRVFHQWVPARLDLWLILFLSIILSFNSGIQSSISGYIVSSQSFMPADMSMASFAYFSGMACVLPFTLRLQQYSTRKFLLCLIFLVLMFLNYVLSITHQPLVMIMVSFSIGFIKMIATLIVVLALIPILMPKGERYQLYCLYYPLSLIFGPVAGLLAAYLSAYWSWRLSFHVQNLFLFAGLLLIIALVHPNRASKKMPLFQYDWIGTILFAAFMLLISYLFSYGLTEDWFSSVKIQASGMAALVMLVLFIQHSMRLKRPLMNFSFMGYWKPIVGVTLLFIFCLFFNTTSLISPFLNIILKNNPLESAKVSCYVIPGYLAGTTLCYLYYRKFANFNVMAAVACASFLLSNLYMYHLTSTFTSPSDLFLPMFLRAMATVITYICVGLYITSNIPYALLNDITVFIITVRSLGAPVIASAFYSNLLYRYTIKHVNGLANQMDSLNPYVVARGKGVISGVQTQATLLAIKDIYGILIIAGIVLLVFIVVFPFHGSHKRIVLNFNNPLYGKEVAQAIPV